MFQADIDRALPGYAKNRPLRRAEGRPLRLRESIAVTRARFWPVLGAQLLVGILTGGVQFVLTNVLEAWSGNLVAIDYAVKRVH